MSAIQTPVSEYEVAAYYDECEGDYRWFWHLDRCLAMHYGYWDRGVRTLRRALLRMNEVIAERAGIEGGERVLDAGCGVGGSAIYLAERHECSVTGLTLSAAQVQSCRRNAGLRGVESRTRFEQKNYAATGLADESFDCVWFVESLCQANRKDDALREACRLLRPGGRVVIADYFAASDAAISDADRTRLSLWARGWSLPDFIRDEDFVGQLEKSGFADIEIRDETKAIRPSARRLYRGFFPAWLVTTLGEYSGFRNQRQTNNVWTAYYQYRTLRAGLWKYKIAVAQKPERSAEEGNHVH